MRKNICRTFLSGSLMLRIWWEYQSVQRRWLMQSIAGPTIAGSEKTGRDLHLDLASSKTEAENWNYERLIVHRRKFRSQTSDYGQMKSRGGAEEQRREVQKREDQRRERVSRKKMQVREKVGNSRNTVFFQWFVAPGGQKVGSLKRRMRSHPARWEMKNCTPLWREAHLQVKMYKTHPEHFLKLRCPKSAHRCGAKHICKWKS